MNPREDPGVAPLVKICGLTRPADARRAAAAGAEFLGVVLVAGTPRALTPEQARRVVVGLGPSVVAVVADLEIARIVEAARHIGASVLQLHGEESPADVARLREQGPWEIWKALSVRGVEEVLRGVDAYSEVVDGILLDGWHPRRRGGSGATFSWKDVAEVRGRFPGALRLVVAGGLNPGNVEEAVRVLKPHVVDVSSGVEKAPGIKSAERISEFILNAHRAGTRRSE